MSRRHSPIHHEVDDGDVRADAYHVGGGYYSVRLTCRVHPEATTEHPSVPKDIVKSMWDVWSQEHWHHP
jgi:hypothetical protein